MPNHPYRTIVVGVDGSRNSDRAASVAGDLAELTGAQVVAVHAVGLLEGRPRPGEQQVEHIRSVQHELETRWTEVLRRTGTRVQCVLRESTAALALLETAEETGADLIVVGRRGHGPLTAQLLGSTSAALAAEARCPVLVVPDESHST